MDVSSATLSAKRPIESLSEVAPVLKKAKLSEAATSPGPSEEEILAGPSPRIDEVRVEPPVGKEAVAEGSKRKKEKVAGKKQRRGDKDHKPAGKTDIRPKTPGGKSHKSSQPTATEKKDAEGAEADVGGPEKEPRLAKRKVALLLGFCGAGYNGMQIQPDVKTIEGTLFDALVQAGAVSKDNSDNPTKVGLQRAARTDAGVHAAGNLVSLKMIIAIPGIEDIVAHINTFLPPEIRVWNYVRTSNSFHARTMCDSRVYEYLFPTYVLLPPLSNSNIVKSASRLELGSPDFETNTFSWATRAPSSSSAITVEEEYSLKKKWRIGNEEVTRLREFVKAFEGTHNFHNYTLGREFSDRAAMRYMIKIDVDDPKVYGDTEWISVKFHGQSFMLHQRKMIGLLMLAVRTATPPTLVPETYGPKKIHIPKAPALGLLLEQPQFGSYNAKMVKANQKLGGPDAESQKRDPIDYEVHRNAMDEFKVKFIYERMRNEEGEHRVFDTWINAVDDYSGNDFHYLNPKGVIPTSAVISKGHRRQGQFLEPLKKNLKGDAPGVGGNSDEEVDESLLRSAEMEG